MDTPDSQCHDIVGIRAVDYLDQRRSGICPIDSIGGDRITSDNYLDVKDSETSYE
jgi:hypothetical protein